MVKVVFFGSGDFVEPVIEALEKNFNLVQVITPQTELSQKADIGVLASYGRIISKETIDSFPYGIINIHPSLLPKYRGPTPVQSAILNGDKKTGVTIIKIDEEVDHGPILWQKEEEILQSDTTKSLLNRLFKIGSNALPRVLSSYVKGEIKPVEQDHSKATFTDHLTRQNGFIDANSPPPFSNLERMIRAYYPWPGVWSKFNNKIIKLLPNQMIQVEGKRPMIYKDFINGYKEGKNVLDKLGLAN